MGPQLSQISGSLSTNKFLIACLNRLDPVNMAGEFCILSDILGCLISCQNQSYFYIDVVMSRF